MPSRVILFLGALTWDLDHLESSSSCHRCRPPFHQLSIMFCICPLLCWQIYLCSAMCVFLFNFSLTASSCLAELVFVYSNIYLLVNCALKTGSCLANLVTLRPKKYMDSNSDWPSNNDVIYEQPLSISPIKDKIT